MSKINCECFENEKDLCVFINENKINQKNVQQVTTDKSLHYLFYWSYL
jgi:hypothetical protein